MVQVSLLLWEADYRHLLYLLEGKVQQEVHIAQLRGARGWLDHRPQVDQTERSSFGYPQYLWACRRAFLLQVET